MTPSVKFRGRWYILLMLLSQEFEFQNPFKLVLSQYLIGSAVSEKKKVQVPSADSSCLGKGLLINSLKEIISNTSIPLRLFRIH
jgi:hypothetical protein